MKGALHVWLVDEDTYFHGIVQGSVQAQAEDKPIRDHLFLQQVTFAPPSCILRLLITLTTLNQERRSHSSEYQNKYACVY
jgi:hypothetical protein